MIWIHLMIACAPDVVKNVVSDSTHADSITCGRLRAGVFGTPDLDGKGRRGV
jgi:hypothetical protein